MGGRSQPGLTKPRAISLFLESEKKKQAARRRNHCFPTPGVVLLIYQDDSGSTDEAQKQRSRLFSGFLILWRGYEPSWSLCRFERADANVSIVWDLVENQYHR